MMSRISICLETVLPELDFYDRIQVAAELGFDAVEFWEVESKDISKIAKLSEQNKIPVAICCAKDVRTLRMNSPSDMVVRNMAESLKIAKEMNCGSVIVLAGDVDSRMDSQKSILIENLKRVADLAVKENITINVEALNSLVDHKGYYLDSSSIGFEIIKCVNCDKIKFLYDIYHMQIMEGNIIQTVTQNIGLIGHIHAAGVPGRHEPFKGENDYRFILNEIERTGYKGYFGLEYFPSTDSRQSMAEVRKYFSPENR